MLLFHTINNQIYHVFFLSIHSYFHLGWLSFWPKYLFRISINDSLLVAIYLNLINLKNDFASFLEEKFYWEQNYGLAFAFFQHTKYIIPLSSGLQCCY